jgi:hypothetical protein
MEVSHQRLTHYHSLHQWSCLPRCCCC